MPDLHFAKPCTFTGPEGETRVFAPGLHRGLSDDVANHWFVKAHLARDGDEAAIPATAPLQHEERAQVKAAMDAAEARARGLEAERDAATSRAEGLEAELATARTRIVELEADIERLTAPDGEADETRGEFTIKHRGRGTYAVMKGAEIVEDGLTKAGAEAKADSLKAR